MSRLRHALALAVAAATGYAIRRPTPLPRLADMPYTPQAVEHIRRAAFDLGLAEGRARTLADAVAYVEGKLGTTDVDRRRVWRQGYVAGAEETADRIGRVISIVQAESRRRAGS